MDDEPFVIDRFAVVADEETMHDVIDKAAEGYSEEQKIRRGIMRWAKLYQQGKADCVCCSEPILHQMKFGAYFICFSEYTDHGFACAFCYDCASQHDDIDAFVAAGIAGMREHGVVMTPLVPTGRA